MDVRFNPLAALRAKPLHQNGDNYTSWVKILASTYRTANLTQVFAGSIPDPARPGEFIQFNLLDKSGSTVRRQLLALSDEKANELIERTLPDNARARAKFVKQREYAKTCLYFAIDGSHHDIVDAGDPRRDPLLALASLMERFDPTDDVGVDDLMDNLQDFDIDTYNGDADLLFSAIQTDAEKLESQGEPITDRRRKYTIIRALRNPKYNVVRTFMSGQKHLPIRKFVDVLRSNLRDFQKKSKTKGKDQSKDGKSALVFQNEITIFINNLTPWRAGPRNPSNPSNRTRTNASTTDSRVRIYPVGSRGSARGSKRSVLI